MPSLQISHVTTYRYREPVGFGEHRLMVRPRQCYDQRLIDASLAIEPRPSSMRWLRTCSATRWRSLAQTGPRRGARDIYQAVPISGTWIGRPGSFADMDVGVSQRPVPAAASLDRAAPRTATPLTVAG